jgi:DNA-binding Xre family transcriptional regulator
VELISKDKSNISNIAGHIMGRMSALKAIRTQDITAGRVREICAEIYCYIDSIVGVVEKAERRKNK